MTRRRLVPPPARVLFSSTLLLASAASSSTVTLSEIEMMVPFLSAPLSCVLAYNTPLAGCDLEYFRTRMENGSGNGTCSPDCESSLEDAQGRIQAACEQINPIEDTLLGRAQRGRLVEYFCSTAGNEPEMEPGPGPMTKETTTTSKKKTKASQTKASSTTRAVSSSSKPKTEPTRSSSSKKDSRTVSTTIKKNSRTTTSSTAKVSRTTSSIDQVSQATPATSGIPQTASPSPSSTHGDVQMTISFPKTTSTTASEPSPTNESSTARGSQTLAPGSGGGSPFDFVASSAPGVRMANQAVVVAFFACATGLTLMLVR